MLDVHDDFPYLDSLAQRFEKEKPGKIYTQKISRYLEKPRRFAPGKPAPDFSLPNPAGAFVSLSSFRGKWVLLDFWASWCKPCRAENPFLIRLNQQYKKRGLQILSVSLDGDRESWMKAMVQDEMNWAHVSDLKGFRSPVADLYGVEAIPSTFLINPEGKIAGRNLDRQQLLEKLVAIFP
jgi:peroxiredoxin